LVKLTYQTWFRLPFEQLSLCRREQVLQCAAHIPQSLDDVLDVQFLF
jgi:hypothetical protein